MHVDAAQPLPTGAAPPDGLRDLIARCRSVRAWTDRLCRPLSPEDAMLQSMPDASPAKWHLAHTSWFFEEFLLERTAAGDVFDERYRFLFNSYYNAVGPRHPRPQRGLLSRPSLDDVWSYRRHIDAAIDELLTADGFTARPELRHVFEVGIQHEQQHQELILTDLKHAFWSNPIGPAYRSAVSDSAFEARSIEPLAWRRFTPGLTEIGAGPEGFAFDNERPRRRSYVEPFQLADRLTTNAEFAEFIESGGYRDPQWWLSDAWSVVQSRGWEHPLYWRRHGAGWEEFSLAGWRAVRPDEPVVHLSFFEADAYARYREARLPTEEEWESAAETVQHDEAAATFMESDALHPRAAPTRTDATPALRQMLGNVWEWTGSPYRPYPGYQPWPGALGEYNGKFMCNQMVLRGGSCATPASHIRASYRNFFPPDARWQFAGVRLARDA